MASDPDTMLTDLQLPQQQDRDKSVSFTAGLSIDNLQDKPRLQRTPTPYYEHLKSSDQESSMGDSIDRADQLTDDGQSQAADPTSAGRQVSRKLGEIPENSTMKISGGEPGKIDHQESRIGTTTSVSETDEVGPLYRSGDAVSSSNTSGKTKSVAGTGTDYRRSCMRREFSLSRDE